MTFPCSSQEPIQQTPTELLDYEINWATRGLGIDIIATSAWIASSSDITLTNETFTNTTTTFWLTGGIPGAYYTITNTITTEGGRTMQETIVYQCIAQRII
ncbi:MAG TPA: hypothetical protein VFE62_24150 [Gemmataceae bacterium]|nr:hypothetical protein [Gemmataceae bacterium]